MDAGFPLQWQRPHLELRLPAARQVFRGLRPARPGRRVRRQEALGRHWIR